MRHQGGSSSNLPRILLIREGNEMWTCRKDTTDARTKIKTGLIRWSRKQLSRGHTRRNTAGKRGSAAASVSNSLFNFLSASRKLRKKLLLF